MRTKTCRSCREEKAEADFGSDRRKLDGLTTYCRACHNRRYPTKARYRRDQRPAMVSLAKRRAAKAGVPFDITAADITIPDVCPVLGITLSMGVGTCHAGSPTLDRIEPAKGYIKSNIVVISSKANRIKNNANLEELQQVVDWLRTSLE